MQKLNAVTLEPPFKFILTEYIETLISWLALVFVWNRFINSNFTTTNLTESPTIWESYTKLRNLVHGDSEHMQLESGLDSSLSNKINIQSGTWPYMLVERIAIS